MVPQKNELKQKKFYLLESKHPNGLQLLKLRFENDVVTIAVALETTLPWYKRAWIALCYVMGFGGPLSVISERWMAFRMKDEDSPKLLSLATIAYLRHLQKKKAP